MARKAGGQRSGISLGWRIFAIIGVIVLLTVGGALVVTQLLGDRFARRSAAKALDASQSMRTVVQQQRDEQLKLISRIFATDRLLTSFLSEPAETRDPASILDSLEEYQNLLGFDLAIVLDETGAVLARTDSAEDAVGLDLSADPLVATAIEKSQALGIWPQGEKLYHAAARPLVRNFEQIGYIIVGLSINDALSRQIQRVSDADTVMLFNSATGPAVAASTLAPAAAAELISSLRRQGDVLGRVLQRGETVAEIDVTVQEREWIAFLAPLHDAAGAPVGSAVALTSYQQRLDDHRLLQLLLIGLGAGSLVAGLLFSQLLSRGTAGPVRKLAAAAEQATAGDYSAPLPAGGSGDVGRLRAALDRLFADLAGQQALEREVTRVHRYLPEPAKGGARERASAGQAALLGIEMRRFASPKIGYDPEDALGRMTRDLQRISTAAESHQGRIEAVFGHRALVLFDGDGACHRALAAATEILHLLSERENVFDEPEPPVVALASGPVVVGSVVWGDQPSTGVVGLTIQQLESLLREAAPGEIYLSKDYYAEVGATFQQAGVKVRAQRGLLSPQPLGVISGEQAASVTGYAPQPAAPASALDGEQKSLAEVRPGAALGGRFDIMAELGAGRMGTIFKARDRELGDLVALKMLKPEVVADAAHFERLKAVIQQARSLRHPNVLSVLDFAETDGLPYVAVEYARGLTLRVLLERGGRMGLAGGVYLARQIASGLHAIHQDGLLHLGLKPENVLVEPGGHARIMDFGLAPPGAATAVSGAGYLAPEQLEGQTIDARTDVFAFGAVLYELFTGQVPYPGTTPAEVRQQHMMQDPAPPSTLAEDLPPALEGLIARALSKAPDGRFESAARMLDALEALS